MIVVDASLAVKWLFRETNTEAAFVFLQHYGGDLVAPEILFIEVAGAIVRRVNERKVRPDDALRMARAWARTYAEQAIGSHRLTPARLLAASSLALEIGHPLKDCLYVALAGELDCDLATCDAKLRDKAVDFYPRIRLLADYAGAPDTSA